MRKTILPLLVAALLLGAPAARAAPTCQNRGGDIVRCDAADAMPVGWTAPPEMWDRKFSQREGPRTMEVLEVIAGIALLFALIALLPEFDGTQGADWGGRETDDED